MADAFRLIEGRAASPLVLTCEHASCEIPSDYGALGLTAARVEDHIGWDVGAAQVTEELAAQFGAPAVLSAVSRLVIDCNRDLRDHDLVVERSDGTVVPGNLGLAPRERDRRVDRFYAPYHAAVDRTIEQHGPALLLSVHSFTPLLAGRRREFDAGVLFVEHTDHAERFGLALAATGLAVRYNEPYSGYDGLIFSAQKHGRRHGIPYLEIELNNASLREAAAARGVAARVGAALRSLLEE